MALNQSRYVLNCVNIYLYMKYFGKDLELQIKIYFSYPFILNIEVSYIFVNCYYFKKMVVCFTVTLPEHLSTQS